MVPSQAVQTGQQGQPYVFVVKGDATVENRPVVVARTQGAESVIAKGLAAGESVVIDGQARLVAGAKVDVRGRGRSGAPGGAPPTTGAAPPVGGAPAGARPAERPAGPVGPSGAQPAGASPPTR